MTTARRLTRCLAALAAIAGGCGGSLAPAPCDGESCDAQVSWRKTYQATYSREVDMLFVIDDTSVMAPHLGKVATGLAGMADRLSGPGPPTSLHVGFIRAGGCDAGTRGGACGVANAEQFLRSEWCDTMTNFPGARADAFACMGDFGAASCAPGQPLLAALQLLASPARAGWAGFLRPDAYLMIIVVTAQDDASGQPLTPASELAGLVRVLKPDPSQILVSIIGPGDCAAGEVPGPRLVEFVNSFGSNGLYLPLCSGDLSVVLDRVASVLNYALQPPCAQNVRDTDLDTPGLQAHCVVEDVARTPDGSRASSRLPSCDAGAPPCWRLIDSGLPWCAGYVLEIDRGADWCSEAGMLDVVECLSCADPNDPACALPAR